MSDDSQLVSDPHLPWPSGWPYQLVGQRLIQKGLEPLGPDTPADQVRDALFEMMTHEDRVVLDELRYLDRRLCVDFFMYQLPALGTIFGDSLWNWQMPVMEPDYRDLADVDVDFTKALDPPDVDSLNFEPPQLVPVALPDFVPDAPINLGPLPLNENKALMDADGDRNE